MKTAKKKVCLSLWALFGLCGINAAKKKNNPGIRYPTDRYIQIHIPVLYSQIEDDIINLLNKRGLYFTVSFI